MTDFLELFQKRLKLDFSATIIERDCGSNIDLEFELKPRDFLRFAKTDFNSNSEKGYINALTNSKRAIDCQIDGAFSQFGIKYDDISKSANKILEFVNSENLDLAFKLKLIKALDFAPSGLIAKTRNLRNKLEHYYKKPQREEVADAIEMAELFILSVESRTRIIEENFFISDKHNYIDSWEYKNYVQFQFDMEKKSFSLTFNIDNEKVEAIEIKENNSLFYALIKLLNNINDEIDFLESFKVFLKMINHPIPEKNVNVEFY